MVDKKLTILAVDDDPHHLHLVKAILGKQGFEVSCFQPNKKALISTIQKTVKENNIDF